MGGFDLSDYAFPDRKLLARLHTLQQLADDVVGIYSELARSRHDCADPLAVRPARLEAVVKRYFDSVKRFKFRHHIAPDDKINQPKIAALLVEAVLEESDVEGVFEIPRTLRGTDFEDALLYEFCYAIVTDVLYLRSADVPFIQKRDFIMCLDRYSADAEWVAWSFYNLCVAYGQFLPNFEGD